MQAEKIVGVRHIGRLPTVDIEVSSPNHIFWCNGIATSNSHGVQYSINSYWSAYLKAHHPLKFHLNWLRHAKSKPDTKLEMRELVMSARGMGIGVSTPKWSSLSADFSSKNGAIYFGVSNVKNCGQKDYLKLQDLRLTLPKNLTYLDILILVLMKGNKRAVENLITVGTFDEFKQPRTRMLHDLNCIRELSVKEFEYATSIVHECKDLDELFQRCIPTKKEGGAAHTVKRSAKLQELYVRWSNPGKSLYDVPEVYTDKEEELMGISLSYSRIESKGDADMANTTCLEFLNGVSRKKCIIACEILAAREHKCKNDTIMAFLTVEDDTAEMQNILVFSDTYEAEKSEIYEGAIVLLFGERSKDALVVQKVELL